MRHVIESETSSGMMPSGEENSRFQRVLAMAMWDGCMDSFTFVIGLKTLILRARIEWTSRFHSL